MAKASREFAEMMDQKLTDSRVPKGVIRIAVRRIATDVPDDHDPIKRTATDYINGIYWRNKLADQEASVKGRRLKSDLR